MCKEVKRYDEPVCSQNTFDHVVDVGDGIKWYIGVQQYSVDPRYTKSGNWEDHFVSENLAKIDGDKVVWINQELSDLAQYRLHFRLMEITKGSPCYF